MNDIIVHISDLHISDQSGTFGRANKNTHLTLNSDSNNFDYISLFVDKVKSFSSDKRYLVITGDISNIAEANEFKEAIRSLEQLMSGLDITKDELLIIPGDHDVHRDSIKTELRRAQEKDQSPIGDLNKIKFENFSAFYSQIKKVDFNSSAIIFDRIVVNDLVLAGVNTNQNVDQNGGHGFIPIEKFEQELKDLRDEFSTKEIILCLHHNLEGEHEDTHYGQWVPANKSSLVTIFERYNIKCILNGNEHTPNSQNLAGREDIIVSDSGAFSAITGAAASFKIYEVVNEGGNLSLANHIYGLRKVNGNRETNFGNWVSYNYDDIKSVEVKNFILKKVQPTQSVIFELPSSEATTPDVEEKKVSENVTGDIVKYDDKIIQSKLYQIIKDKKLYHQGHFHWSETSRAHNWIDIAKLLQDNEDLYFLQNSIIDVIEKMKLIEGTDLIIGLGYEGNIISSRVSIKYDVPYTYLPYSYRYKDHHEFENKLNFENEDKKFKKVLLITDVVNDGRTIRKLVGKENREKKFFDNVDEIVVVSLFYTGHKIVNNNILNYDNLSEKEKEGDEVVNKIEYYTIQQLKVEKCPYGKEYKDECFILRDNLHCVYKFYSET